MGNIIEIDHLIARALPHRPKILILDEPATGLDPQARCILWKVISDLRKNENMTVFLTTHYMEEAADADCTPIRDSIDCNVYFFGNQVTVPVMYGILPGSAAILTAVYVLMQIGKGRR